MSEALTELLKSVETAEHGSMDLDKSIMQALGFVTPSGMWSFNGGLGIVPFTTSIDAALSLVERMLPGWHVQMNTGDKDQRHHFKPWAKVVPNLNNDAGWQIGAHDARASTQPLAVIASLLKALIAKGEEHE